MITNIDYLAIVGLAMAGSAATVASLFVGFFLIFVFFGKESAKVLISELNFFQLLQVVSLAVISVLPVRWLLGYLGSTAAGFIWFLAVFAGVLAFIKCSPGWISVIKLSLGFMSFFFITAIFFYGAWYQPNDLFIGDSATEITLFDQSDLLPHYILSQMLAYGKEIGFYSSPLGYPAKLTLGSYLATIWSGVNAQLATLGNSNFWSVSLMGLGVFFFYQLGLVSVINIFLASVERSKTRTLDLFRIYGISLLLVLSFLHLAIIIVWDPAYISDFFIHSINNGAGISVILSLLASGIILCKVSGLPNFRKAAFFLFLMPAIVFARANWIGFIYPLALTFVIYSLYLERNKAYRIITSKPAFNSFSTSNLVIFFIALVMFISPVLIFGKFAFPIAYPGPGVGFNFTLEEAYVGFLHYHMWYPDYSKLVLSFVSIGDEASYFSSLMTGFGWKVMLSVFWQLSLCLGITFLWFPSLQNWFYKIGLFLSLVSLSSFMFILKPLYNGFVYGSTEPMGHALLLVFALVFVGVSLVFGGVLQAGKPFIKWVAVGVMICLSIIYGRFGIESQSARDRASLGSSYLLQEVRGICSESTKGIYSNNEMFDALSGCVSIGEGRYSEKLSSNHERQQFQLVGKAKCETLVRETFSVKEINGKHLVIVCL
jgi:hypothetical protein